MSQLIKFVCPNLVAGGAHFEQEFLLSPPAPNGLGLSRLNQLAESAKEHFLADNESRKQRGIPMISGMSFKVYEGKPIDMSDMQQVFDGTAGKLVSV